MTKEAVLNRLQLQVSVAASKAQAARDLGISQVHLHDVLAGRKHIGGKILAAMGLEEVKTYRKVGA